MSHRNQKGSECDELVNDLQSELSDRTMVYDIIFYDESHFIPVFAYWKEEKASL